MSKIVKNKILEQLSPMYNVVLEKGKNGKVFILKDAVKFGLIKDKNLYFINQSGDFVQMDSDMINDSDSLLLEATKSFWYARSLEKVYEKEA